MHLVDLFLSAYAPSWIAKGWMRSISMTFAHRYMYPGRAGGRSWTKMRDRVFLQVAGPRDSGRHFVSKCSHCACSVSHERGPNARSYYRKRGSASYIVREWLLWVVERERETPVTSSISRWNREWSCIWLPRQRVDPMHMHTRRRVLSLHLLSSARSAWQAKTTNSNSCDRAVAQYRIQTDARVITGNTTEIKNRGRRPRFFISRLYFP